MIVSSCLAVHNCFRGIAELPLMINPLSDNVGYVKHVLSTLQPALGEERHFGLAEEVLFQPKARLVIHAGQAIRSDPSISSIQTAIMITSSDSPTRGAGCPINISMFYCTP